MRGNIRRGGKRSWRLKFDLDRVDGQRRTRYATVKGTRRQAEAELTRLLSEADRGVSVDPSNMTVASYLRGWLAGRHDLAPTSRARYAGIVEKQTIPVIGDIALQKLRPIHVKTWLDALRKSGYRGDGTLSAASVGTAHRLLSAALRAAVDLELISRNPCLAVKAPAPEADPLVILDLSQVRTIMDALKGKPIFPIVSLALATGMRRGELLGLQWGHVDFTACVVKVDRQLTEVGADLAVRKPKTRHGTRTISVPASTIAMLHAHRAKILEMNLKLALGKIGADDLVFSSIEGQPIRPNHLSILWRRATRPLGIDVRFHALRHTHASALIAAGVDVVTVSRRLGHSSAAFTLRVYAHQFARKDDLAAAAIEAILK